VYHPPPGDNSTILISDLISKKVSVSYGCLEESLITLLEDLSSLLIALSRSCDEALGINEIKKINVISLDIFFITGSCVINVQLSNYIFFLLIEFLVRLKYKKGRIIALL
jgi:hypothetical protein